MQKLRPYIIPGLFLFHLVMLCVMIFTVRGDAEWHDSPQYTASFLSQLLLTALWAGLGSGPLALRLPGCGALAALSVIGFSITFQTTQPDGNLFIIALWVVLVGLLLCLRVLPFLKWQIVFRPSPSGTIGNPPVTYSLTRGMLIVIAAWAGVFTLFKASHFWWEWDIDQVLLEGDVTITVIVGGVLLLVTMICVGLTLTRLADWMFYRRRWTLPLLFVLALIWGIRLHPIYNNWQYGDFTVGGAFAEFLVMISVCVLVIVASPTSALLLIGLAGYRLASRRKQLQAASTDLSGQGSSGVGASPSSSLPLNFQEAHVAALISMLVLFCGLIPTGLLEHLQCRKKVEYLVAGGSIRGFVTDAELEPLLEHLKGLTKLEELNLAGTQVTDAGLVHLKGLTNLKELHLDGTQVTDAGLVHLKGLTNLKELHLDGTQVTDAGLVHLKGLTNLKELHLAGTQVTDAGLVHLAGMNLTSLRIPAQAQTDIGLKHYLNATERTSGLNIAHWKITDAGLVHLAGLTNLTVLLLGSGDGHSWAQVTDDGLVHLKGLTNLRELNLNRTQVTDVGLVHLAGLTNLTWLGLVETQVTDAGLEHLKGLTNLESLYLDDTQVTDAGLEHLKGLTKLEELKLAGTQVTAAALARLEREKLVAKIENLITDEQVELGGPIVNSVDIVLVPIPTGEFLMGSPETEVGRFDDETQHRVQITKPFYLSACEVTQAQYEKVMGDNPSTFKAENKPVEMVSWDDAMKFCQMLNEKEGEGVEYRLPTEAEWEYACRAGTTTAYSFGDDVSRLSDYAWWGVNSNGSTHPVGGLKPNAWGLFDMHGNVLEWCQDWYGTHETERVLVDPKGPESGSRRVLRGGAFNDQAELVRAALRNGGEPNSRYHSGGFRLARTYPLSP